MSADSSGKISLALGGAKKLGKPAPTNGIKRPHAALRGHDDEENEVEHGKSQTVSHFDQSAGGAIDSANRPKQKQPLVIAPQANRDWKEASGRNKRQANGQVHVSADVGHANGVEKDVEEKDLLKTSYGLIVRSKTDGDEVAASGADADAQAAVPQMSTLETIDESYAQEKSVDEQAMDALLGRKQKSNLVLPAVTEEEAFERDFKTAPDMATLDDYARVPVEEFGAALLRGMGWKDGEGIGRERGLKTQKTKMPARRPALLGIGAKEEAAVAQELGTWGRAAKDRKGPQQVYNPVLLRDKKTGELFTEEELEKKKARAERERYEQEFEEKERRKEKERRRERDESRDRDRDRDRRDRSYKKESEARNGGKYDESEDEYRRRKEDERRRRKERDRDSDRPHRRRGDDERTHSRRYEDDRERQRDRHRDHRR